MRCVLLSVLETMEDGHCLIETVKVVEVPEVMCCVMLDVLDVMRVLLCILEAVEDGLCMREAMEVMRCVLLCIRQAAEGGLCSLGGAGCAGGDALCAAQCARDYGGW